MVIVPQPYPKEQCENIASGYAGMQGKCIPAPKPASMCNMVYGNMAIPVPCDPPTAGYHCGQFPDKCKIDNIPKCIMSVTGLECK